MVRNKKMARLHGAAAAGAVLLCMFATDAAAAGIQGGVTRPSLSQQSLSFFCEQMSPSSPAGENMAIAANSGLLQRHFCPGAAQAKQQAPASMLAGAEADATGRWEHMMSLATPRPDIALMFVGPPDFAAGSMRLRR
jgi:hypothetical protein